MIGSDLASNEGRQASKSHHPDTEFVGVLHDVRLQFRQLSVRIHVVELTEELLLRIAVAGRSVTADGHPDGTNAATLSLRLPHGMEDAFPHPVNGPVRTTEAGQFHWQRILDVLVLTTAPFEQEPDFDVLFFPLFEMENGRSFADVVPAVLASERIDRVGAQLPLPRGFLNRLKNLLLHGDLVHTDRRLDLERRHTGILADGGGTLGCHIDIHCNGLKSKIRLCPAQFPLRRGLDRPPDIRRKIR